MSDDEDAVLDAVTSVSHGAVVGTSGIVTQKALLFLTNLALTSGLAVELYGVYALGKRISAILLMFAPLGAKQSLVRFLPEDHDDPARRDRVFGIAVGSAAVASLALAAATVAFAGEVNAATVDHPAFPAVLVLFAVLVPLEVGIRLLATLFRALQRVEYQLLLTHVLRPGTRLAGAVAVLAVGRSVVGVAGAFVVATAAVLAVAAWLAATRTDVRPRLRGGVAEARRYYNHAGPAALSRVGALFRSRVDVLLVGALLSADAAGVYNLALFLTSILAIPLYAFNQLLPPVASRLYAEGDVETLDAVYGAVTRLVFTATMAFAVTAFVYRTEVLAVFGAAYTRGSLVLALFVLGRVVGNGAGATGWLLLMTDHQYVRMLDSWVLGLLNLGLSYYFVLEFGLVGAALGTASSMAVVNLVRLSQLYYYEGLWPYDASYLKPVAAAGAMAAVMVALRSALDGAVLLAVGTACGVATFAGVLWLLGVDERDRAVVGTLAAAYRA